LVPETADFAAMLLDQMDVTRALAITFGEAHAPLRYAPGKWSVRETVGHLADCERVLSYRLLRALRSDATPLVGFDHEAYVPAGRFEARPLGEVVDELASVREATVQLVEGTAPKDFAVRLPVGQSSITGLALAYLIAGHERHHQLLLRTRYLPCLPEVG
ncbi:MAG TPA: DinB family protein, partial [Longimicrobiales bacterium]|nr:DinB family protein [Longimicrobiales bacterium]